MSIVDVSKLGPCQRNLPFSDNGIDFEALVEQLKVEPQEAGESARAQVVPVGSSVFDGKPDS